MAVSNFREREVLRGQLVGLLPILLFHPKELRAKWRTVSAMLEREIKLFENAKSADFVTPKGALPLSASYSQGVHQLFLLLFS